MNLPPDSHFNPDAASAAQAAIINGSIALLSYVRSSYSSIGHAMVLLELAKRKDDGMTTVEIKDLLEGFGDNEVIEDLLDNHQIEDCIGAYNLTASGQMEVMAMCGAVSISCES